MILLYTGATAFNAPQQNAADSLGGYPSSTGIPNGRLANLFPAISKADIEEKRAIIRMIALKNTSGADRQNVKIYTNTGAGKVKLKIAAVASALDSNNNPVFESVLDSLTLPYQAELDDHEGVDKAIAVGTIANNQIIGIWILREIDPAKFPEFNPNLKGAELVAAIEAATAQKEELINLIIEWD